MPTTAFWLMHAGFAAVSGAAFLLFKLALGKRMVASAKDEREQLEADALASRPA
jgi:proton-dependent oligopeptide transporter, POT family